MSLLREAESTPMVSLGTYNASGVITINTVLIDNINCSKMRSVFVSGQAGTTGVITPEFYNAVTATWFAVRLTPPTGATVATIGTTASIYQIAVMGDLLRFRLSTATTAGNTQLAVLGAQENICINPNTIAATQSGTWNIGTVTPGTAATNLAKAEDAAHASGDAGVFCLGVRVDDASAASPSATGDYTYQHVNRKGALSIVPFEHHVRGYRSSVLFTPYASSTDIIEIFGNATTIVEIRRIAVHGIATSANQDIMYLIKRSAANTGGTKAAQTAVPLDTGWAAASSVPQTYSVIPTGLGASVGNVSIVYVPLATNASGTESGHEWEFGVNGLPPLRLTGTSQGLVLNRNAVAVPGGMSIAVEIEWIEYIA